MELKSLSNASFYATVLVGAIGAVGVAVLLLRSSSRIGGATGGTKALRYRSDDDLVATLVNLLGEVSTFDRKQLTAPGPMPPPMPRKGGLRKKAPEPIPEAKLDAATLYLDGFVLPVNRMTALLEGDGASQRIDGIVRAATAAKDGVATPRRDPGLVAAAARAVLESAAVEYDALEKRRRETFDDDKEADVALLRELWEFGAAVAADFQNAQRAAPSTFGLSEADAERVTAEHAVTAVQALPFERFSKAWEVLGFQGEDPTTDLRGGGMYGLDVLVDFIRREAPLARAIITHCLGQHASDEDNWILLAVASIQMSTRILLQKDLAPWSAHIVAAIYRNAIIPDTVDCARSSMAVRANLIARYVDPNTGAEVQPAWNRELWETTKHLPKGWSLRDAVYRLHHTVMRDLFTQFVEHKVHVMEFTQFVDERVLKPFFRRAEPVAF